MTRSNRARSEPIFEILHILDAHFPEATSGTRIAAAAEIADLGVSE